ncbi:hypothetical protein CPB85DRAFT_1362260 [Mucidula mucida]|nr:hypothetical protein CPB85DRAFT_1362260 [Mucidula mucida]
MLFVLVLLSLAAVIAIVWRYARIASLRCVCVSWMSRSRLTSDTSMSLSDSSHLPPPLLPGSDAKWRKPFPELSMHKDFETFIYSFTWEDPYEDLQHFQLTETDRMLVITSAGDNALHYALAANPQAIHCVDMNPCQGHLLELKLAALSTLDYEDFFALFGHGQHPDFANLLELELAPYLSEPALSFWREHNNLFSHSFYRHGFTGWAIRVTSLVFRMRGISSHIASLLSATTVEQQKQIWLEHVKPVFQTPMLVRLLKSPMFCWYACGVPSNQRKMLLDEGTLYDYLMDTFEPVLCTYLLKSQNHFLRLCLTERYTYECCPEYLTPTGFYKLKDSASGELNAFHLHTSSIIDALRTMEDQSLTRMHLMDHLDWFSPDATEIDDEIKQVHRVLTRDGAVFWRSAAKKPWYNARFERLGFKVMALSVRQGTEVALDMVNMYASFYKATII